MNLDQLRAIVGLAHSSGCVVRSEGENIRLDIDNDRCINFYGDGSTVFPLVTQPHSHRRTFISEIIQGQMINETWAAVPGDTHVRYHVEALADGTLHVMPQLGRVGMRQIGERRLRAGETYLQPADAIHIARIPEPTITYVIREERNPRPVEWFRTLDEAFGPDELNRLPPSSSPAVLWARIFARLLGE